MNTITNLNTFPIGNSLDGVNIITEEIGTLSLLVDGTNSMLGDLNMDNHSIKNMEAGVDSLDAVNFSQLSDLRTYTDSSLNLLRTYTDSSLNLLRTYTDSSLNLLRTYTDSSLNLLRTHTDSSLNLLRTYTDSSLNTLRNDVTSALNLKLNKAGDTMTGDLNISLAGTSTTTNKQLNLQTNNNGLWFNPYFSTGAFNPLIQNGSKGIIFSNGTVNTGELFIAPWSNFNYGLQISSTGETTIHGKLLRNAWSSGELIQTKIYNQNTSGSGVLQLNGGSGATTWKSVNFTMLNTVSDSNLCVEVFAPYHLTGNGQDRVLAQIRDFTSSTEQEALLTGQYWDNNGGGGTRSGIILPMMTSYTPNLNTSNKTRTIEVRFNNYTNDTLYICRIVNAANIIADCNYYTIKISEYKK